MNTKMSIFRNFRLTGNIVWISLFAIGIGLFFIGMPKYTDDYWYMMHLRPWFESQDIIYPEDGGNILRGGIPFREIWATWSEHYGNDNIRFGNLLAPILLIFPKWVGSGFTLVCLGIAVIGGFVLADINWRKSPFVPIGLCMWMFLLPWYDGMGSLVFQLNYAFTPAVIIVFLIYLKKLWHDKSDSKLLRLTLLGVMAGACHEGFSAPLIGVILILILILFDKTFRKKSVYYALAGVILGFVIIMSCPGIWVRIAKTNNAQSYLVLVIGAIKENYALWVLSVLVIWTIIRGNMRAVCQKKMFKLCVGCAIASIIVACVNPWLPRGGFPLRYYSILSILILLPVNFDTYGRKYTLKSTVISLLLLSVVYGHLFIVGEYSIRNRKTLATLIPQYLDDPQQSLFGDLIVLRDASPLAGFSPDYGFMYMGMDYIWLYYGHDGTGCSGKVIFPDKLRNLKPGDGISLGDGSGTKVVGKDLILPNSIAEDKSICLKIDFGKGFVVVPYSGNKFISEYDGREYLWILPQTNWYVTHFKKAKSIKVEILDKE